MEGETINSQSQGGTLCPVPAGQLQSVMAPWVMNDRATSLAPTGEDLQLSLRIATGLHTRY